MITTLEQWLQGGPPPRADICLVGGGPVGLDLAVTLARSGRRVLVLEGGGRTPDPRTLALNQVRETGRSLAAARGSFFTAQEKPRRAPVPNAMVELPPGRVLGGGSTVWSGRWKAPDADDFEPRPWMASSGWPLAWTDVASHIESVAAAYAVPLSGAAELKEARPRTARPFALSIGFEQLPPEDFARRHERALMEAANVTVVLGANAVELLPAPGGAAVGEVVIKGPSGGLSRVGAGVVVLAAGAIETARLLLNSTRFGRRGPGNANDLVGRGFMDHLRVRAGRWVPTREGVAAGLVGTERSARFARVTLPAARRRELQLPDHALALAPIDEGGVLRRVFGPPSPREAWWWIEPRRCEQSRVSLDNEKDETGTPAAAVHWQLSEQDADGLRRFAQAMTAALAPGLGQFTPDGEAFDPARWLACGHAMGTARMGATAGEGVVDRDSRVFGVDNLFVAGTAVFPVAGGAEPLLLALALGRRLAGLLTA